MAALTFPSEVFPGPPSVEIDVPDNWYAVPLPGTLLASRGPAAGGPAPNVIVRSTSRPSGYGVDDALAELRGAVEALPNGHVDEPFGVVVDTLDAVGVNVSWVDEDFGVMVQVHVFLGLVRAGLLHLVQATGTVGGATAQADYATIHAVLTSLRVQP